MLVDTIGITDSTGFIKYWPELPALTNDLQALKSIAKSATVSGATVMLIFIFSPLCWPLGVVSAVSTPPVGLIELASGAAALLAASTSRICVYLPAGSAVWPSGISVPLVSVSRSTRVGAASVTSDQPLSPSDALPLMCTRTFSTVTNTLS